MCYLSITVPLFLSLFQFIHFSCFTHLFPISSPLFPLQCSVFFSLVVGAAAFPLPGVVHARRADGGGDEVGGAGGHEVTHGGGDVHPLVGH